jgi:predicted ATPase
VESLRAAWADAAEGRGRTLLLRGEAGIGKSRLLEAAEQLAVGLPHEVLQAECSPYHTNSPLHPIVEMLERRMGSSKDMAPANKLDLIEQFAAGRGVRLEDGASALAGLLSVPTIGRYPEIEMSPARRRQWTIETLADLLLHSAAGSPVLLVIEDLHWADPSTLDLLGEIVARQANVPALVVGTTRHELSAPWLGQLNCREVQVESLPPEDARALVALVAGGKTFPLALREELVARTAGIPLFVEAVTRTVLETGILRELADRYELTSPLPPGLIPATVQDSLMGRIDRLGVERPVAQVAATIGRESSFELLQAVLGKPAEVLASALRQLVDLELVSERGVPPKSTYTFKHSLIQDAAYESLLRKARQDFHGRIAEVLIDRFPDMAETKPELMARHFEGAGRTKEAITGWMKAGVQAQQRMALRECSAYLQKAISLLETLPHDDPYRLRTEMDAQLALALALTATFGWASRELEAACTHARDLCKTLGNQMGLLQVTSTLTGMYFVRGAIRQALEVANVVLEMAMASGDPVLQIMASHTISFPAYFYGDFVRTREHAETGVSLYTLERERAVVAIQNVPSSFACANVLALSLCFLGYPTQAEQAHRNAWEIIEALNIPACTAFALGCTLDFRYLRRDHVAVARLAEQTYRLSTEEGYLFWAAHARIFSGWARAMNGNVDEGIAEMRAGLESYHSTGSGFQTPRFCLMMAEAYSRADDCGQALAALSRGLAHARDHEEHVYEPDLHRLLGEIQLKQGEKAAGEASLHRAVEVAKGQQTKLLELRAVIPLARLYSDQGRIAEARALLQPLYDWFQADVEMPELLETRALLQTLRFSAQHA